jgi:glycopeptide antibiotics resistance protein
VRELKEISRTEGGIRTTGFYNSNGELTDPVDRRYAVHTEKTDAKGRLAAEDYYCADGKRAVMPKGFSGIRYMYPSDKIQKVIYVDAEEKPMVIAPGYACIRRMLNAAGQKTEEYYYDLQMQAVKCSDGYYGIRFAYDKKGMVCAQTFLDADGKPMKNKDGITREKYLRNSSGQNIREMYFDEKDRPVQSLKGEYGVGFCRDDRDRPTEFRFLDVNGVLMTNTKGYAIMRRTYRPDGEKKSDRYFDKKGKPCSLAGGEYGVYYTQDSGRNVYLGADGKAQIRLANIFRCMPFLVVVAGVLLCVFFAFAPGRMCRVAAMAYVGFIIYMTLLFRGTADHRTNFDLYTYVRRLFHSFESRAEIINNIWLFIPLGAFLRAETKKKKSILLAALLSLLVETVQLLTGRGTFELNDLVGNTAGGAIGFWLTGVFSALSETVEGFYEDSQHKRSEIQ